MRDYPARGAVTHAVDGFIHAGGGGVVAAAVLAELGAEVDFFCALGADANGEAAAAELATRGVNVHAAWRERPTRRVFTMLEVDGPRTIVTIGDRLEPHGNDDLDWDRLDGADGVYFTAGDADAVDRARKARVLVSTPRAREAMELSPAAIDALVFSASDDDERRWAQRLQSAHAADGRDRGTARWAVVGRVRRALAIGATTGPTRGRLRLWGFVRGGIHVRPGGRHVGARCGRGRRRAGSADADARRRAPAARRQLAAPDLSRLGHGVRSGGAASARCRRDRRRTTCNRRPCRACPR